jgi:hypothetical protein
MPYISICKTFPCPFFSEGVRSGMGSIGGYGCQKFSVAGHCPVNSIKNVYDTQYELSLDQERSSQNDETVIALTISHLVFKNIQSNF